MRNTLFKLLFFLWLSNSFADEAPINEEKSKYIYCNVYLDSLCFGLISGDSLNMRIPVDFVLYDIELNFGEKLLIYYGFNPESIDLENVKSNIKCAVNYNICDIYKFSNNSYRVQYQLSDEGSILDVVIKNINPLNYKEINNFFKNFKKCYSQDNDIICSESKLFPEGVIIE